MTNTEAATARMFAVKITDGFEQNNRYVGRYETKAEAIAASRWMQKNGFGRYCVAVPAK